MFRQKQQNQNRGGKKGGGPKGGNVAPVPLASLEQKHPVSLLGELASKRKWGAPNYTLVFEQGPAHAKNFIFKVSLLKCATLSRPIGFSINPFYYPCYVLCAVGTTGPFEWHRLYLSNAVQQQEGSQV